MLLHELTLKGLLSFGPDSAALPMRPLNVLIGPNGSGKSNLLEAIGLLRSTATNLTAPMRGAGGGVKEWIWKGVANGHARLEAIVDYPAGTQPLWHMIEFTETASRLEVVDEAIPTRRRWSVSRSPSWAFTPTCFPKSPTCSSRRPSECS